MLFSLVTMAACAIPLAAGPDRRDPRAWAALTVMVGAMAPAVVVATPGAHLLGGALALVAAPLIVAGVDRRDSVPTLHRAASLLLAAWALFAGAGVASVDGHHSVNAGPALVIGYLAVSAVAARHRRRDARLPVRIAAIAEVVVMAAGLGVMTLSR